MGDDLAGIFESPLQVVVNRRWVRHTAGGPAGQGCTGMVISGRNHPISWRIFEALPHDRGTIDIR